MGEREKKLESLGYPLDRVPGPGAIYKPVVVDGTTVYISGAVPFDGDVLTSTGKVPTDLSVEEAQKVAALCAANLLRLVRDELGSLDRIERLLKLCGFVNSDPDFTDQHLVINGASQLMIDVLGKEAGIGARSAIGTASLPLGSSVEVDLVLKCTL